MRFTPTSKYLAIARGLAKTYDWRVFVKKTSEINEPLDTGSWLEVTARVTDLSDCTSRVEYEIGQFTCDTLNITAHDIEWWKTNVFNIAPPELIELKLLFHLNTCEDTVVVFSGFIDTLTVVYEETVDSLSFTVWTAQDLGSALTAENLTTQYIEEDVTGGGTRGLIVHNIPGLFIVDANVGSNILLNGDFEDYSGDPDDASTDTFTAWTNVTTGGRIEATLTPHQGATAVKFFRTGGGDCYIYQVLTVTEQSVYELTFFARGDGVSHGKYAVYDVSNSTYIVNVTETGMIAGEFARKSLAFITPNGCTSIRIELHASDNAPGYKSYFDSVHVSLLVNSSTGSWPLVLGQHTLQYSIKEGAPTLSLDGGEPVELQSGPNTLGNGDGLTADTQRVKVYIPDISILPTTNETADLVVLEQGETLPNQWYVNIGVRTILQRLLSLMGIDEVTFGRIRMISATGEPKLSFLGSPPEDETVNDVKWATAAGESLLFISIANKVHSFDPATDAYSLITEVGTTGDKISRMFFNARTNDLWIIYGADGTGNLARYRFSTETLNSMALTGITAPGGICLVDFNYTGSSYKYAIVYIDGDESISANGDIREVDGDSLIDSLVFSAEDLGYSPPQQGARNAFMYVKEANKVTFTSWVSGPVNFKLHRISIDSSGDWVDEGILANDLARYFAAAYHPGENRIYYYSSGNYDIDSHVEDSSTVVHVTTADIGEVYEMTHFDGKIFFTSNGRTTGPAIRTERFYSAESNAATEITAIVGGSTRYHSMSNLDGVLYALDRFGRLWQYHTTVGFYVAAANFPNQSVTDAFNSVMRAFNLVGNISSTKKGIIFPRADSSGTPKTTGNILKITVHEAGAITEENSQSYAAVDLVEVSNGVKAFTYDGTSFNTSVLSNARRLTIQNSLIPDEIVQDLCYYIYQFFKTGRTKYRFYLGVVPLFQFEPLDGCTVTFDTTKIKVTASGKPIYTTRLTKTCDLEVEVLV